MKNLLVSTVVLMFAICTALAQDFRKADKSPLDYAYLPDDFAHDRKEGDKAIIRVTYSRPGKNDREVFGKLVPYGKVWRTGANENTEIKFYQDVEFGGKQVKAGSYSLFTIPGEKEWTVILNSDLDYWGSYKYNEKNDIVRVTAPVTSLGVPLENFSIQFEDKGNNQAVMRLGWDKTAAEVPVKY
jgi:hypothetical protein